MIKRKFYCQLWERHLFFPFRGLALAGSRCNDTGAVCSGGSGQGGSFDQGVEGGRRTAQCIKCGCPKTVTGGFGVGIGSSSGVGVASS